MDIQELYHLLIKLFNPVGKRFNPRVSQARHTSHKKVASSATFKVRTDQ